MQRGRPPSPRPPRIVARLKRQARRVLSHASSLETERARLYVEIKDAARDGMSHAAIAQELTEAGYEISRATVQRIVSNS